MLPNLHEKYAGKNTTVNQQAIAILRSGKLKHEYENQKPGIGFKPWGLLEL